ncbi:hypothetical protein SELMODRAFT_417699 [Selaginella moellendorffii]|uniref:F-box associated domain-containing protein n=1 Tax=Selaginella moellendorffii TaxID=88036 RepID=D8S3A9_SELML|nr:hypothetical protein SELMODRAFT_417699 [Selaginella moellendorffii]
MVGNPITGNWCCLPELPVNEVTRKEGKLLVDPCTGYFKVLVFLPAEFDHYWLFNSLSREWRHCQFTSKKSIDDLAADDKGPWLGSSCYDRVKVKFPSNLFCCGLPCIVDYNGRWILVSSTISGCYKVSAAAWELNRETSDWKLLSEVYMGDLVKNGSLEFEYFVVKHSVVMRPSMLSLSPPMAFFFKNNLWTNCSKYNYKTAFMLTPDLFFKACSI